MFLNLLKLNGQPLDNNSYISIGAKIRPETLIGKNCKIGGEVSNSIFYKNSNKAHDGFIGHSFIGEWVNIGAGTNNSNLKNNYSNVKFTFNGKEGDSTNQLIFEILQLFDSNPPFFETVIVFSFAFIFLTYKGSGFVTPIPFL